jgi:hypothetical protein
MIRKLALPAAALLLAASIAVAHPPGHRSAAPAAPQPKAKAETPGPAGRNLQVLPANIPQERLMLVMRNWGQALGVQCSYCHVPGNFRSDANPHKNIARGMVRMTANVNDDQLPKMVGASQEPRVTCYSCHRGAAIPDTQRPEPAARRAPDAHIAPDTPARPH